MTAGTNGITVAAGSTDVVILRNLYFDGLLGNGSAPGDAGITGIQFVSVDIQPCTVFGFNSYGIETPVNQAARVTIEDTVLQNNALGGVKLDPATGGSITAALYRVIATGSMGSNGFGIGANPTNGTVTATVADSEASANVNGVSVASSGNSLIMQLRASTVSQNSGPGLVAVGSNAFIVVGYSQIVGNSAVASASSGGSVLSYGNNQSDGNASSNTLPGSIVRAPADRDQRFRLIATTPSGRLRPPVDGGDGGRWVIRESAWLGSFSTGSWACLDRDYPCVTSATC